MTSNGPVEMLVTAGVNRCSARSLVEKSNVEKINHPNKLHGLRHTTVDKLANINPDKRRRSAIVMHAQEAAKILPVRNNG